MKFLEKLHDFISRLNLKAGGKGMKNLLKVWLAYVRSLFVSHKTEKRCVLVCELSCDEQERKKYENQNEIVRRWQR